jgi:hypothetical protein
VVTIPLWVEHPYIVYRDNVSGSEAFDNHLSLNVGSAMQLDFRALELTSDDQ